MSLCFANNCLPPLSINLLAKYILVEIIRSDQLLVVIGLTHGIPIFTPLNPTILVIGKPIKI